MTDTTLIERIDTLTNMVERLSETVLHLTRSMGARLSRKQVCERLDVCSKTLTAMVRRKDFPEPASDGQWLLAEVVEWEAAGRAR